MRTWKAAAILGLAALMLGTSTIRVAYMLDAQKEIVWAIILSIAFLLINIGLAMAVILLSADDDRTNAPQWQAMNRRLFWEKLRVRIELWRANSYAGRHNKVLVKREGLLQHIYQELSVAGMEGIRQAALAASTIRMYQPQAVSENLFDTQSSSDHITPSSHGPLEDIRRALDDSGGESIYRTYERLSLQNISERITAKDQKLREEALA